MDRVTASFEAHYEALYRYLVRLSSDADVAADAAQEAFVRLLAQDDARAIERGWLFKVATNHVLGALRSGARQRRLLGGRVERTMADPPADPSAHVEAQEERDLVAKALGRLSEKERIAVLMREEGFTHREIADAVGTTTGSIGTLLVRALDKLARELTASRGGEA